VSVDLIDWDDTLDQAFGPFARTSNFVPGGLNGYVFTYSPADGSLDISILNSEAPSNIGPGLELNNPKPDPATSDYRIVFMGSGDKLRGQMFDLAAPGLPLATLDRQQAETAVYASGMSGLINADTRDPEGLRADTTFDNYVNTIAGDANADGTVDVADLGILATNFNGFFDSALNNTWSKGDFNLDNVVDVSDLGELATNFNRSVIAAGGQGLTFEQAMALPQFANLAAAVPEPAAVGLVALGAMGILARRRR
jgi:hypothetical protein